MMNTSQTKTVEEIQNIREQQLADYRKQQEELAKPFRSDKAPITVVPVHSQLINVKKLLNEVTALNVSSLNLGGGAAQTVVDGQLDYKLNELANLIHTLRYQHKYSGKLIS